MFRNLAFFFSGLAFSLYFWEIQPELPLRYAALGMKNPWVGVSLFYLLPLLSSILVARFLCRWREGIWLVAGSLVTHSVVGIIGGESYSHCPLYNSCGTGDAFWMSLTAVIPAAVGKALALAGALRSPSHSCGSTNAAVERGSEQPGEDCTAHGEDEGSDGDDATTEALFSHGRVLPLVGSAHPYT